jgi:tripartite ATP-independent transporter DctP family solute receptor
MDKRLTLKLIAASAVLAAAAAPFGAAHAQTKLKWAHVYETSEPFHKWSVWAGDEIKKRTNGKYEVQVFPASSLGKESDINQGLTLGTVDIILTGASFAASSYKPLAISYFPFIFRDAEHQLKYAKSDVFRELAKGYDDKTSNHITAMTYYGARQVTSNRPIQKPEDMKGLKIRVPDAPAYLAFPKALGANPTPIAFAEVYLALQNGTVEAQENPLPTIEAKKFFEVQKNISLTGHIVDCAAHRGLRPAVGQAHRGREEDLHRRDAGSAEKTGLEIMASEARLVEEFKKKGNNVITVDKTRSAKRPQDHQAHGSRISPAGLRPHPGHQVTRPAQDHSMETIDDMPHVMGEDGQFHAQDEAVDLSGTALEAWVALGFFWILGLTVFYQFFTRYVMNDSAAWTEEIARYLLIATVFTGATIGVVKNNHIQVDFFYRFMSPRLARAMATLADLLRIGFFAAAVVLTAMMMIRLGSNSRMTMIDLPMNWVYGVCLLGFSP